MREQIKHLHRMIEVVEGEMKALEGDLAEVIVKRDLAYARIQEIRRQRDDSVSTCPSVLLASDFIIELDKFSYCISGMSEFIAIDFSVGNGCI